MKASTIGVIATVAVLAIGGISVAMTCVGWNNKDVELRNLAAAQQKANEAIYDEVWKVIKQKAQITDKYATDFKGIYTEIMGKRYQGDSKGSPMFKWIQEQNPEFSVEMYKDLSDAISGQRAKFTMVQKRLIDIKREHDDLRKRFPSSLLIGGRPEIEIIIVTSTKAKEVFANGVDNEVELF